MKAREMAIFLGLDERNFKATRGRCDLFLHQAE
jgi:hypothetical protein